jgi:phosphoribosyl-ATP pyrophosphohydrolase
MSKPKIFYFDLNENRRKDFIKALEEAGEVTAPETVKAIWAIEELLDFAMHIVARDNDANQYTRDVMRELQLIATRAGKTKNFLMLAIATSQYHKISCLDYANRFFLLPKDDAVRAFILEVQKFLQENER